MISKPKTLDDWLASVTVDGPFGGPFQDSKTCEKGWFIVRDYDDAALAWLPTYTAAYRFRLDHINRNLNHE
jgi:hypothetical protein